MRTLNSRIVDSTNSRSLAARARKRRWSKLLETFPDIGDMHVLDLGGTPDFWASAPVKPQHVTLINLQDFPSSDFLTAIQGNACTPPERVAKGSFDMVFSNSLIEHVGGHAQRTQLADVIHGASPRHWVQTPYRYFPIEPHWFFPAMQFLPFAARVEIAARWKLGHHYTPDRQRAVELVHEVELLTITQMADYFPDSEIWREKFGGLVKSIVAVRSS